MKTFGNLLGVLLTLSVLTVLAFGVYLGAKRLIMLFARLDFPVAFLIGAAVVTLLLAAIIVAASIRRVAAQSKGVQVRAERAEVYKRLMDFWSGNVCSGQNFNSEVELPERQELNRLLVLYGSAGVVKAHLAMQSLDLEPRNKLAALLLEIRKDLGTGTITLGAAELLQLFPSDLGGPSLPATANLTQDLRPRITLSNTR